MKLKIIYQYCKIIFIKPYLFLRALMDYFFREWVMYIPIHFIRNIFIRITLKSVGKDTSFLMGVEIRNGRNIYIGDNCVINKKVLLDGRGGKLVVGNNVDIAQETNIWTLEHDPQSDWHADKGGDVMIEDYVWIASRVTVLPGVRIGRGAVIACNSVVTNNVEGMTINAGIPARKIGERNSGLKYILKHEPWFQ